jgi:hypothetical protein
MKLVLGGSLGIAVAIWLAPVLQINLVSAVLIVLFGFFFVTVSSRITGEIGSSSNPISGMTVATLLLTCGLFVLVGWTGVEYKAMALTTAALVCVAASNGGTISQDLKTGYLVGATPRLQQIAILVGVVTSAIVIGATLLLLAFQPLDEAQHYDLDKDGKPTLVTVPFTDGAGAAIARGKYLVDEQGQPMFFVDSAIGNAYPYKLVAKAGTFPTGLATSATGELCSPNDLVAPPAPAADAPAKAPVAQAAGETRVCRTSKNADGVDVSSAVGTHQGTELGLDRQPYQSLVLTAKFGGLAAGHYLVRANNEIAFEATPIKKLDAPKPHLFALIIDGILGGKLPWGLVLIGVLISLTLELCGVRSLSMAVGLYLPISVSGGVFVGGLVRWLVDRKRRGESAAEAELSPGMLMASGLIAGGSIAGVLASGLTAAEVHESLDFSKALSWSGNETWWPLIPLGLMAGVLAYVGGWAKKKKS